MRVQRIELQILQKMRKTITTINIDYNALQVMLLEIAHSRKVLTTDWAG